MGKLTAEVSLTPKQVAEAIFELNSEDQAEMFEHLHEYYEGDHYLMMQFMCTRESCMERGGIYGKAMSAFQTMFSSAYKYML
jgi:hypothetical protein